MSNETSQEDRGIVRLLVRWLVRQYHSRIEVTDGEKIPQTGPVLLCANHPNSLIDPIVLGIAARRPVRFLAKAPLFKLPVIGSTMTALGMVPAFRGSDDSKQVRKNLESLETGAQILLDNNAMGIFPEGKTTDSAQVEMVRSGASRMAMDAADKGATGLQIVPIGLNYEHKDQFRSSVWIRVGEPIDADSWLEQHDSDTRKAMRAMTKELETRLKDVVVHLDEVEWEPFLEDLEVLVPAKNAHSAFARLHQRKRIADAINHFLKSDRERVETTAKQIESYRDDVHASGLHVNSTILQENGLVTSSILLWQFLVMILLFVPAFLGTLHHFIPLVLVRTVASRFDHPGRTTISTNRLIVGIPAYLLWYAGVLFGMLWYFSNWFAWVWLVTMPFAGLIALDYWRKAGKTACLLWHQILVAFRFKQLKQFRVRQSELRENLMQLAEEYARIHPHDERESAPSKRRFWIQSIVSILLGAIFLGILWIAYYWIFDTSLKGEGLDLASLSPHRLRAELVSDEKTMIHVLSGIDELEADAQQVQADFDAGNRSFAIQGDNDAVRELMRRYLSYRDALFRILWKYQRHGEVEEERLRLRAFLIDFTAGSALYELSLKFVHRYKGSSDTIAKLNEAEPNWEIPAGLYDTVRHNLASRENRRMLEVAREFYRQLETEFDKQNLKEAKPFRQFHAAIARSEETFREIDESMEERVVDIAIDDFKKLARQVHYETQSAISTWTGDLKIREPRAGQSLIDKNQLAELSKKLKPGDILLERRNWYLSNAFLPGYWPHAAIYVGTFEDLETLGLSRNEHVQKHWEEFSRGDYEGHRHVIIEAVSEGVIFSSLEHSMGEADAVAVLRPNLTEEQKKEAIVRAFSFAGRPYDFEFDFSTTDKLVCTEVVFRSYGGNSGPIAFPVVEILGRPTMPAINLVEKFQEERDSENPQLQFVAFLDGDEVTGTSVVRDEEDFVKTLDLPGLTWWSTFKKHPLMYSLKFATVVLVLTIFFVVCWKASRPNKPGKLVPRDK